MSDYIITTEADEIYSSIAEAGSWTMYITLIIGIVS